MLLDSAGRREDFLERGQACAGALEPVLAQRPEALGHGHAREGFGPRALLELAAQARREREDLEQPQGSAVARARARPAALAAVEDARVGPEVKALAQGERRHHRLAAARADLAHDP